MPDLLNHKITRLANVSVSLPRWQIEGTLVDSQTQTQVLADFTGANAIVFPQILTTLTVADREEMVQMLVQWVLQKKYPGVFA